MLQQFEGQLPLLGMGLPWPSLREPPSPVRESSAPPSGDRLGRDPSSRSGGYGREELTYFGQQELLSALYIISI